MSEDIGFLAQLISDIESGRITPGSPRYKEIEALVLRDSAGRGADRGKTDLFYLSDVILRDPTDPEQLPLAEMHKIMCDELTSPKPYKLLLWFRGSLKSTIAARNYPIQYLLNNPDHRVMITSANLDKATKQLGAIKEVYERHAGFRELYGDWVTPRWKQDEIWVKPRTRPRKEPSIFVASVDAGKTGYHADLIVADDLVDRSGVSSVGAIQATIDFYRELWRVLEPGGKMVIIGTRWAYVDLYSHILASYEKLPLAERARTWLIMTRGFYRDKVDAEGRRVPWWPEKFKPADIEFIRGEQGAYAWAAQYENRPIAEENISFRPEWLEKAQYDEPPEHVIRDKTRGPWRVYVTVDPASRKKKDSDYTAIIVVAVDKENEWYILDMRKERLEQPEVIDLVFEIVKKWRPLRVGIESVGYQDTLKFWAKEQMSRRNTFFNVKDVVTANVAKPDRIKGLIPRMSALAIHFPRELHVIAKDGTLYDAIQLFRGEYDTFPVGIHPDLLDALAYVHQVVAGGRPGSIIRPGEGGGNSDSEVRITRHAHRKRTRSTERPARRGYPSSQIGTGRI
jgi:hypothetical protein